MNQRIAPEQPAPSLRSALWTERRLLLYVEQDGHTRTVSVTTPYARIGSDPRCEVQIDAPSVPRVAYYVHATRNGIFAVGFAGTADHPPVSSWLEPDQALRVGGLQIYAEFADPSADTPPDAPPLLDTRGTVPEPAPVLSVRSGGQHHATTRLQRRLTTIGRAKPCALRLKNRQISLPHCALYWQDGRVWIIDLLSRNGTVIDAVRLDVAELTFGVPVRLGDIELILSSAPDQRDLDRQQLATDRAAVAEQSAALETLRAELARDRAELDRERTELDQLRSALQQSQTESNAISAQRNNQQRKLDQLRSDLEQNQTALATAREDLDHERQEFAQIRSAFAQDRAKLAAEKAALAQQQHDLNQLRQELDLAQAALTTAREELDHDRQDLANQQQAFEQARAEQEQQQAVLEDERKRLIDQRAELTSARRANTLEQPAPRPLLPTRNTAPRPANREAPETHPTEKPRKRSFFW